MPKVIIETRSNRRNLSDLNIGTWFINDEQFVGIVVYQGTKTDVLWISSSELEKVSGSHTVETVEQDRVHIIIKP